MKLSGLKVSIPSSDLSKLNDSDDLIAFQDPNSRPMATDIYSITGKSIVKILRELAIEFTVLEDELEYDYLPSNHLHY